MADEETGAGQDCGHQKCDGEPWRAPTGQMIQTKTCHICSLEQAQTKLREAQETIDGMRREGCAAVGLVQNIFNGLTSKGAPTEHPLDEMADACADLLVTAKQCDHKAERDAEAKGALAERLKAEISHWVMAYGPDLIVYPSKEEMRAVNETPEFVIGRNATMQVVSEGLQAVLDAEEEAPE